MSQELRKLSTAELLQLIRLHSNEGHRFGGYQLPVDNNGNRIYRVRLPLHNPNVWGRQAVSDSKGRPR